MLSTKTGQYPYTGEDLSKRATFNVGNKEVYVGYAQPGALTSETKWQIQLREYDGSSNLVSVTWASGTNDYDKEWDERASYSYS